MATEQDRRTERDRMGDDPMRLPSEERLEEENPVDSPEDGEPRDGESDARKAERNESDALGSGEELPG